MLMDEKTDETRIQPEPLPKNSWMRGIPGVGNQDNTADGQDDPNGLNGIETFTKETNPQDGNKNGGQVGKK